MSEGRKSQIILPDERRLDILIQPKLYASELLDIVSSHFKLKEKEYFGIAFQDETGHYNWLQLDKKVLEHDLPRKQGTNLVLSFLVRFYLEQITQLRDSATVELFYLNAKQSVFKGHIECDSETVFELAAHVLQTTHEDYIDDATTKADLKKLPLITTSALKEHPSIQYCEERVISYYTKLEGTTRGSAIVNYMTIVESLPTYGIHYFDVKDKKDIPWWLGISNKGIAVFDKNDKNVPRRVFVWKNLENLYYRDKKFSIEVHDPKRVSVSRRTFGPGNVNVHAWFGATAQLTKCIWSMAVAQHQFYHDRKNSRAVLPSVRSVSDIANELSRSTSSLHGSLGSDISRSGSSASLPSLGASRFDLNFDPADTAKVQREMFSALKARREALDDILRKKTEELKLLCVKEGELTGILPPETPLAPGEEPPQIRRRVGTAFALDVNLSTDNEDEDRAGKLELELELQKQITSAAHKLASDKSVSRFVRKQRRHSFMKATSKMKEMEKKLNEYRKLTGKSVTSPSSSGSHDGTYCVFDTDTSVSSCFSDDMCLNQSERFAGDSSFLSKLTQSTGKKRNQLSRLNRSFREKNLLKPYNLNRSCLEPSTSIGDCLNDSARLDESRLCDASSATTLDDSFRDSQCLDSSYEISADSMYNSSYKYIPENSVLEVSFNSPSAPLRRKDLSYMSPNTRRSKRASWHHTLFAKMSPQVVPRATLSPQLMRTTKETTV